MIIACRYRQAVSNAEACMLKATVFLSSVCAFCVTVVLSVRLTWGRGGGWILSKMLCLAWFLLTI